MFMVFCSFFFYSNVLFKLIIHQNVHLDWECDVTFVTFIIYNIVLLVINLSNSFKINYLF